MARVSPARQVAFISSVTTQSAPAKQARWFRWLGFGNSCPWLALVTGTAPQLGERPK